MTQASDGPPAYATDSRRGSTSKFPFSRSTDESDESDDEVGDECESGRQAEDAKGELLCVVAFTRHGDRTPKQKLKFVTREPSLLAMITEHGKSPRQELKVKKVRLMEELDQRVERIVERMKATSNMGSDDPDTADSFEKYVAVKQVLKSHPFSGINRKVQIKPTAWETVPDDDGGGGGGGGKGGSGSGSGGAAGQCSA